MEINSSSAASGEPFPSDTASVEMTNMKREILDNILYPNIKEEIKSQTESIRGFERKINVFTFFKYCCLILSPVVLSMGSIFSNVLYINFVGSALSMLGLSFDKLVTFIENKKKIQIDNLNIMLNNIGIEKNIYANIKNDERNVNK